ncbi:uncharacterized protein LOC142177139 [Nicotiana tabacum]|uniref:Uncharacterized protein LOC142177139 n=1 Tax=Nicotiana tabacum TaxID=4097 RepID=A0AC58TWW8_TOBAC
MPNNLLQEIEQLESQKKPNLEEIEVVNLGSKEDVKETKIIIHLEAEIQNEFADVVATLSSIIQHPNKNYIDPIKVEIRDQHAYCFHVDEEPDGKSWYMTSGDSLKPESIKNATNSQKQALMRLANHFFINGEILYRRTPNLDLLRCVDATEATRLLEEIHAGTCGPRMNGFPLAKRS